MHRINRSLHTPPLRFGIYPGGAAGTVGPSGGTKTEDPSRRLAALNHLRPAGRPFVLHLYASFYGPGTPSMPDQLGHEIGRYTAAGFQIELVLCYRGRGAAGDVTGFVDFVRNTVRSLGSDPALISVQVTNEANVKGAPNAADGYYYGAKDALIQGVIAAKREIRSGDFDQIRVGFNWAYEDAPSETAFWSYLGRHGGSAFITALDWVGLDVYPGTWGPSAPGDVAAETTTTVLKALHRLRATYMPLAGIPKRVEIRVCENGYPTGPGRSEATQVSAMTAAITTIDGARRACNITDYRWFDLRDADSSSGSFENHYGLLYDDYSPKPAFGVFRALIARLSVSHPAAGRTGPPAVP